MHEERLVKGPLVCKRCGRNASIYWWQCCPKHIPRYSPEVYCQACVEQIHPRDNAYQLEKRKE